MSSSTPSPTPAVSLSGVSFAYGSRPALDGVDLEVRPGEVFGILGPNGGGKSTTFRILSTQLPAQTGQVRVFGLDPATEADAVREQLGVVFQDRSLDPKLSVRENLVHQGHLHGLFGRALQERVDDRLTRFGLADRAGDRVESLSGGQARRVDLCRGTLHRPALLLLDEPTTGLDPAGRRELWELIHQLRDEGTTVVLTTHLMDEADRCDRLAILSRGRVIAEGSPDQLREGLANDVVTVQAEDPDRVAASLSNHGIEPQRDGASLRWHTDDGPADLATLVAEHRAQLRRIQVERPSLDDVFFAHTGRHLDQEEEAATEMSAAQASHVPTAATGPTRRPAIWRPAASLARRELVRFFRQRSRVIGSLATPAFFWVLLGTGLGQSFRPPGYGDSGYLEFFYPGMLALTVLFTAIFATISVIEDRHLGFLQSVLVAPVSRSSIVLGKILGGSMLGLLQGALLLALAPAAGLGLDPVSIAKAMGSLAVMAMALTGLGFALAWKIDSTQGYHSAMNTLLVPMWILSGAVFPSTGSGAWVGWAMKINPLAYGLASLRHALGVPAPETAEPWVGLLVMASFGLVLFFVSVALVRRRPFA